MNRQFLLKFLTPMTWLLWAMIAVGMVDHFFLAPRGISMLPQAVFDWFLIIMWPVLLARLERKREAKSIEQPKG